MELHTSSVMRCQAASEKFILTWWLHLSGLVIPSLPWFCLFLTSLPSSIKLVSILIIMARNILTLNVNRVRDNAKQLGFLSCCGCCPRYQLSFLFKRLIASLFLKVRPGSCPPVLSCFQSWRTRTGKDENNGHQNLLVTYFWGSFC